MANKVEITISVDMENEESVQEFMDQLEKLKTAASEKTTMPVEVDVDDDEIDTAKEKEEELNDTAEVEIEVDDNAVQNAMQNISQGFATLKQGAAELGQALSASLESAGKQETNFSFLKHALNNDEALAKQKMQNISEIVQALPGDDTAVQGLLSQAIAKDASLAEDQLKKIGVAYADYASAMSFYGKSSVEAQQDMTNYILAGNTAELERSPILASHIDKLKEANTIQERSEALQKALNEEHWGGMSQQDTYNNKLETFNGMLERGKYNLGGMFQEGAKGLMDFAIHLDDATGGLVGMSLAAASFASPLSDMVIGVGQMATGVKALRDVYKDLGIVQTIANAIEGEGAIAHIASALGITTEAAAADGAAVSFGGLAIAEGAALWPILAIIAALALLGAAVYEVGKYFGWWTDVGTMIDAVSAGVKRLWSAFINNPNVQGFIKALQGAWNDLCTALSPVTDLAMQVWNALFPPQSGGFDIVRSIIDGFGQVGDVLGGIVNAAQIAWNALGNFFNYLVGLGSGITSLTGITASNVINGILGFLVFFATLPLRIGVIFANTIARALGFGNNFVQRMYSAATNAVSRFTSQITQLPGKLQSELNNMLSAVGRWASTLPQKFWDAGVNAVKNFLSALGIASPGTMQRMLVWEISEMGRRTPIVAKPLLENVKTMGQDIVDNFGNPTLGVGLDNFETLNRGFSNGSVDHSNQYDITNNFNINGIIEEEASEYIVGAVNDYIKKQNLIRGV